MVKNVTLSLNPKQASQLSKLSAYAAQSMNIKENRIKHFDILKKSIDARQQNVKIIFSLRIYIDENKPETVSFLSRYKKSLSNKSIIIVGAGPAGLFAALKCIEYGVKPIILERGKDVSARKSDIALINRPETAHLIDENSNYCFGEGGAGTFSDGKLYTRSNKRGNVENILQLLIAHGANPQIAYEAHPHIGSDKLPGIIANIRKTILNSGGEIRFNARVNDIIIKNGKVASVRTDDNIEFTADAYLLACGHSAHDIYELFLSKNLLLEPKPFAIGVRVEHPQELINNIQYKSAVPNENLPPATYKLVTQVNGRGVFSFCMCPGGIIVPAASKPGELVVNGMSNSKRNSAFANSGIVVSINPEELPGYNDNSILSGLKFQQKIEQDCFIAAGSNNSAPAQRMTDFCDSKMSKSLIKSSYNPGITNIALHELLPNIISDSLQKAFVDFGKKMKGFYTEEALLLAPESRTSSPIRIPRHPEKLSHLQLQNLYPCGEGAGYAGGITSSAIDGENSAIAAVSNL
ncbi:MAG: NAD(P)/FAD-dependent oxidoreductase [Bacteroidota bacterium]